MRELTSQASIVSSLIRIYAVWWSNSAALYGRQLPLSDVHTLGTYDNGSMPAIFIGWWLPTVHQRPTVVKTDDDRLF